MMIVKATSVLISPNILSGNQTLELIKVVLIPDNKYGLVIHYLHTPYSLHMYRPCSFRLLQWRSQRPPKCLLCLATVIGKDHCTLIEHLDILIKNLVGLGCVQPDYWVWLRHSTIAYMNAIYRRHPCF